MEQTAEILKQLGKMDEKLDRNNEQTQENKTEIRSLRQSLEGNGGKGLFKRMNEAEGWQENHVRNTKNTRDRSFLWIKDIIIIVGAIVAVLVALGVFRG